MTSANFFNGYAADKPTSRVINPPGGRSNNIFGGYEEEKPKNGQLSAQQEARNNKAHQTGETNIIGNNNKVNNPITGDSQVQVNKPKNQRSGFNPITGQSYGDEDNDRQKSIEKHEAKVIKAANDKALNDAAAVKAAEEAEHQRQMNSKPIHTSTKVHQPPGGKSTALW